MDIVAKMLASPADKVPGEVTRMFVETLSSAELIKLSEAIGAAVPETDHNIAVGITDLAKRYKKYKQKAFLKEVDAEARAIAVIAGTDFFTDGFKKVGMPNAIGSVARAVADRGADWIIASVDEEVRHEARALIVMHIEEIRVQNNLSREQIDGLGQQEARQLVLQSRQRVIDSGRFRFLDPEDRETAILQSTMLLEDALTRGIALNKIAIAETTEDVEEVKKGVERLVERQAHTEKAMNLIQRDLDSVHKSLGAFETNLRDLSSRTDLNTKDIKVLQEVVFSGADLSGKIHLLEAGVGALNGEERKKEITKLKVMKAREQLKADVDKCLENGRHVMTIANNLGVDLPKPVSDLANVAQIGLTAYSAYLSGNPLAAASAVSGLFGGGSSGDQVAAQRHAEIMKKLAVLDKKLDEVLSNQRKIMRGIVTIIEYLEQLSDQILQMHGREMDRLHRNLGATLYNRISTADLANRELYNLVGFAQRVGKIATSEGGLTYDKLRALYELHGGEFSNGKNELLSVLNAVAGIDPYLRLITYEGQAHRDSSDSSNEITVLINGFNTTLDYISELASFERDSSRFDVPVATVRDLIRRQSLPSSRTPKFEMETFSNFVSSKHLVRVANAAIVLHPLYVLQAGGSSNDQLYGAEDFFDLKSSYPGDGRARLKEGQELARIAIAQESLLSGDFLLLQIYDDLIAEETEVSELRSCKACAVLRDNALLRLNFSKYLLHRQLETPRVLDGNREVQRHAFEYFPFLADNSQLSAQSPAIAGVRSFFDAHLHERIVLEDFGSERGKRWSLKLGEEEDGAIIPLPDEETYNNGIFVYRPDMYRLHSLRDQLFDAYSSYECGSLTDDELLINRLRFVN